jgi:hypothetical protein
MNRIESADALNRGASKPCQALALACVAMLVLVGCGKKAEDAVAAVTKSKPKPAPVLTPAQAAAAADAEKEKHMATAVTDGKKTAPVDLRYDVPTKPDVNQPFPVELSFDASIAADSLDVEIADAPGLTIEGDKVVRFAPVEATKPYGIKLQVRGDAAGLYYLSVVAKIATKVQTETRAFAIPIVIGTTPAAEKPAPAKDASGQPVQPMPAKES